MLRLSPRHTLSILLAVATTAPVRAQPAEAPPPLGGGAPTAPASTRSFTDAPVTEPQLTVWLGHAESDNLARSSAEAEGSYESLGLLVGLGHDSTRLQAQLNGDLEFRTYSLEDIDDETIGNLDASANIGIVPGRVNWTFRGNHAQGVRDPFAAIGPLNRESIRTLGTGPSFDLPLASRTSLSFSGEYSARRFDQSSNVDSDATIYRLGIFRLGSSTARFGISFTSDDIDYPDTSAPSYRIDSASLRYEKTLATGRVIAALGRNEVDTGISTSDGPLVEFEWARDLASRSNLSVRAGRGFTDSGNFLSVSSEPAAVANMTDVVITASPVERTSAEISYRLNGSRTQAEVSFGSFEDAFLTDPTLNNDSTSTRVSLNRTVSSRLGVNVTWSRLLTDVGDPSAGIPRNEDTVLSAWINRTLGRRFSLAFVVSQYERESIESFDDRRYELRFSYSPTQSTSGNVGLVGR